MGQCFTTVDQSSAVLIEQFGKFNRIGHPGFNCIWCCAGEAVAGKLSLRIQQLDVRCETKSKDNVFVDIVVSVQYQVVRENVYDAFYKLTDSKSQIRSYVYDEIRGQVPKMNLDDVFISKEQIAAAVKEELAKSMTGFGFAIVNTLITDIEPAAKVKAAMNDINAAQRLRLAAYEQSEADKIRIVKAAEADAEAKYLAGQGIARQRQAIISGLRESVQTFQNEVSDVNSRDVMELLLITQYFDTLKDIGSSSRASTVFLPHGPGSVGEAATAIRNGVLSGMAGSPPPPADPMQR
ncbi:FAP173 [Auxenochlorella protothecoides x Auxenochlorella symbiontica]